MVSWSLVAADSEASVLRVAAKLGLDDPTSVRRLLNAWWAWAGALTARDGLWMATREGARALGLEEEIGSIEAGKRADLIVVERDRPHLAPDRDPWSTLVYAARGSDVRLTMVDGTVLVDRFRLLELDALAIAADARSAARELSARAGI